MNSVIDPSHLSHFISASIGPFPLQLEKLKGDASDRHYWRARENGKSWILSWTPDEKAFDSFLKIQNHLASLQVPVPSILARDKGKKLMLLEDCGNLTFEACVKKTPQMKERLYDTALALLIRMQRDPSARSFTFVQDDLRSPLDDCKKPSLHSFSADFFLQELKKTYDYLFHKMLHIRFSAHEERSLWSSFKIICHQMMKFPLVFTHRDYHSRNILLPSMPLVEKEFKIIDFQDARLGPITYDLCSLLHDCYVDLEDSFIDQYLSKYFELSPIAPKIFSSEKEFRHIYWISTVQ